MVTNPRTSDHQPQAPAQAPAPAPAPAQNEPTAAALAAAELQTLVLDSDAVHEFLDRLAYYVADQISTTHRAVLCGITLVRARSGITVASNSDRARAMDEVQYAFGDGPCLDAAHNHRTNYLPDINDDSAQWPEYRALVAENGLSSILSVPIPLDPAGGTDCAINVYADTAHAFSDADIENTQRLAREAADTVRIAVRIAHLSDTAAHLKAAMNSRTTIDLAAGIIMAQNRCSQEAAITILKAATSARNLKLHDLAATVVTSISTAPTATHFDG